MEAENIFTIEHIVSDSETADKIGSGGLPVFSTPSMIALMEKVSFLHAERMGLCTVGTKVNISHLRACKAGTAVKAIAELLELDGRRIEYAVKVEDENGIMGEGTHQRFAIDPERFMARLK